MTAKVALIVATRNRPQDLGRLLATLQGQTRRPDQVVIVDSSDTPARAVAARFPELAIEYVRHWPPSAAAQRNAGLAHAAGEMSLIGFVDDDTEFEPQALERMLAFWEDAPASLGGAAFNMRNSPVRGSRHSRTLWLANSLGLYRRRTGAVAPSGWQSVFGEVPRTVRTEWLPSGAVIWRADVLRRYRFDEFFDGYSYMEDVDMSYTVGKEHGLAVVADAGYYHYLSPAGRGTARSFGRVEARNRLYFVHKHQLSLWRCHLGLAIRFLMTLAGAVFAWKKAHLERAMGNLEGVAEFYRLASAQPAAQRSER